MKLLSQRYFSWLLPAYWYYGYYYAIIALLFHASFLLFHFLLFSYHLALPRLFIIFFS